jgi:hypothetical protein
VVVVVLMMMITDRGIRPFSYPSSSIMRMTITTVLTFGPSLLPVAPIGTGRPRCPSCPSRPGAPAAGKTSHGPLDWRFEWIRIACGRQGVNPFLM